MWKAFKPEGGPLIDDAAEPDKRVARMEFFADAGSSVQEHIHSQQLADLLLKVVRRPERPTQGVKAKLRRP
ncbi:hypothetical protein BH11ACT6_BH11ACT6_12900 [soil metagenome]